MQASNFLTVGLLLAGMALLNACKGSGNKGQPGGISPEVALYPVGQGQSDRAISIFAADTTDGDSAGTCNVDNPIVVVRKNKKHTIEWDADDKGPYWIQFVTVAGGIGTPSTVPLSKSGTQVTNPIKIEAGKFQKFDTYKDAAVGYYMYEIWTADPTGVQQYTKPCMGNQGNSGYPCKCADDDRDTGVNVKR